MPSESGRMHILQMIEDGQISAAKGLRLLEALSAPDIEARPPTPDQAPNPSLDHWRRWWMMPLWVGIGVLLVGSLLMFGAYQSGGFGFGFACATLPFIAGVLIMALAASSRSARWLHVRVRTNPRTNDWPRDRKSVV